MAVLPVENIPGRRACPTDRGNNSIADFRPERFRTLSPDGQRLITDWAERADQTLRRTGSSGAVEPHHSRHAFEAFIYAWISFNGWASCCCDSDRDRKLIDTLRVDDRVTAEFDSLVTIDPALAEALDRFRSLWPIFRASDVRSGLQLAESKYSQAGRQGQIQYYSLSFPEAGRAPDCHLRHGHDLIDADWAHTLEALYRVRCNLFHGTKSIHGEVDRNVVGAASTVLVPIVRHLVSRPFH